MERPRPSRQAVKTKSTYLQVWKELTFVASGSGIVASSTQSAGFLSSGSSISFDGFTGGSKSSRRLPFFSLSPLMKTS